MHNFYLHTDGVDDPETLAFWQDLHCVMDSIHQGMSIVGPWMEERVKTMIRSWIPEGWDVSGPSQVFISERQGLRSRSWDIVIHRPSNGSFALPPPASAASGLPLLPMELVAAVIDTKTNFSDPATYAAQAVFNLMNDATESQLRFLGPDIAKIVLAAASSSRSPESIHAAGLECGLSVFSLARYRASPVSDGWQRISGWRLECHADGTYPLQRFKAAILSAVAAQG